MSGHVSNEGDSLVQRRKQNLIHRFEQDKLEPRSRSKANHKKCVKQFSRAAAGQELPNPGDIRPPHVLLKTVQYLFDEILAKDDEPWSELYDFVFDRLRAVRQDMVIQDTWTDECAQILVRVVRFHIYSIYKLCEAPLEVFDPHINAVHLQECLKRLLVYYLENSASSDNRSEVEAYYLLFNLGSPEAVSHALTLPSIIRCHPLFALAMEISLAYLHGNFVRVFRGIKKLPFLVCAAVMSHIRKIQRFALMVMSAGYSIKNSRFPLKILTNLLLFDSVADAKDTCTHYGIRWNCNDINFQKQDFRPQQPIKEIRQFEFVQFKHSGLEVARVLNNSNDVNLTL